MHVAPWCSTAGRLPWIRSPAGHTVVLCCVKLFDAFAALMNACARVRDDRSNRVHANGAHACQTMGPGRLMSE